MILYFNDYKLIYIITMMGKINNIPVLNEDVIRLVVLNEEIIGYIYPRRTSLYLANLHTSFLCNLIYPTFSRILLYSC